MLREFLLHNIETLGFIASALGMFSLVPQVIKTWQTRSVKGISLTMYAMICVNSTLWLTYALTLSLTPLIVQSLATLSCASAIALMKLYYR